MAITPGTRLGVYDITAAIGEGGMGQVFRARDTKLDRDVAIKILPEAFAHDAERLARFTREAKTLAALNHPNIAAIFGLEESGGVTALVMELVEGEDLSQRIARGAIPIDEALPIAKQIAEALEAAHEQGIIHRDLKPANIKVRPDGTVKVLDFGLAKAMSPAMGSSPSMSTSPTITTPAMTQAGMILGTAAYMSPEQARAKPVDKRADIWAFGAVLFEMLTGTRAFQAEDVSLTLAEVIKSEPKWFLLPATTPASVRGVMERCLDKEPRQRLRDIGEARIALDRRDTQIATAHAKPSLPRWRWLPWAVAMATTLLAAFGLFAHRDSVPEGLTRLSLAAPEGTAFPIPAAMMALSPDGRTLAFVAVDARGKRALWYRRLDARDAVTLAGTDGASAPFWSPDSRSVGYVTDRALVTVEIASGRLRTLCECVLNSTSTIVGDGTWRSDGTIVFAGAVGGKAGLYRVSASGGLPTAVIDSDHAPRQSNWRSPWFLPDGQHFLYLAREQGTSGFRAYVTTVDNSDPKYLFDAQSKVEFAAPRWLVFVANGRLLAQEFDAMSLTVKGEPIALAGDLLGNAANGRKAFSVSGSAALAFRERPGNSRLELRDRSGRPLVSVGRAGDLYPVGFSSDDKRVLFRRNDDVWTAEVATGKETRLTFDPAVDSTPVWSPDTTAIAFVRDGRIRRVSSDGRGTEEDLGGALGALDQWHPDGTRLLSEGAGRGPTLIRITDGMPESLQGVPQQAEEGQVSPDGRWLAYAQSERGDYQVYVKSLGPGGGRWQVSQTGGRQPRWRRDGRELFYVGADGNLQAAQIRGGADFAVMSTQALFDVGATTGLPSNIGFYYDVSSDGQRFVFSTDFYQQIRTPITFILNWQSLLSKRDDR